MPSSLRELLSDHPHATEIARVLDPRPHSAGWRRQRFEDSMPTFSQLARGLPEGVALADTAVMGDRSPSVETVAIVRERVLAIVAVIAALPTDERAVIAAEAEAMASVARIAGIGSVRTAWRRLASAKATIADAGVSDDELAAVLDFLPLFNGAPVSKRSAHHLDSITRAMTADEEADLFAGYAASWYAARRGTHQPAPTAATPAKPKAAA